MVLARALGAQVELWGGVGLILFQLGWTSGGIGYRRGLVYLENDTPWVGRVCA